jgi:AcrR family transcriptional regulator
MPVRRSRLSADQILEAAEAAFTQHGYADVSLRQLIAATRVSTTAFYARFESKEALIGELVAQLFTELYAGAAGVLDGARDVETGIELGVDYLCEQFADRKSLVRMVLSELGSVAAAQAARQTAYRMLVEFLASRIAGLGRKRAKLDPTAVAWAIVGALEVQLVRWAVWEELELAAANTHMRASARAILAAWAAAAKEDR